MKKLFYLLLFTSVFVACTQSPEQKAEVLIKESLKKYLYKPETYKPVDTRVDSAFAPSDNPALFEELKELGKLNSEYEELEEKVKDSQRTMSIYSGSYMTEFDKNQYREAKSDYEDANAKIEKLREKGEKQYEKVIKMIKSNSNFIGYKATHNYRADNNAGNTLIGNDIFFIDKDFKEITYEISVEEYNQAQEAIKQLLEEYEEMND